MCGYNVFFYKQHAPNAAKTLDKAVDGCYRPQPFVNETRRIEFLFELYDKYTSGMFQSEKAKGKEIN
jgi:hypothetical protein